MSINRILLTQSAQTMFNLSLSEDAVDTLEAYYDAVIEANKEFNLTAITGKDEFVEKHFLDSLSALSFIPQNASVLDVGTGAGFPALPLAAVRPDLTVTALDSTEKKTVFVADTARFLGIKNIRTVAGRAEDQRKLFASFDVVLARAVSALPILLEICVPLLKVGGIFIAYKTSDEELPAAENALKELRCTHVTTFGYSLPSNSDRRALLVFKKTALTPAKYPRQYGAIKKKPL